MYFVVIDVGEDGDMVMSYEKKENALKEVEDSCNWPNCYGVALIEGVILQTRKENPVMSGEIEI